MSQPLLSIVVPTKDRYKYLIHLIQLIDSFNTNDIELVIQDNTNDNDLILSYLNNHYCEFVKYFHTKELISVSENSTKAILNSSGEYVCFLGDDDGVLSSIVDVVRHMKDNSIDYLISLPTIYNWPDFYDPSIFNLTSSISYLKGSKEYIKINPAKQLKKSLLNGFDGLYQMPRVYQGVVSRCFLEKIREKTNTFFPGPSPDMANSVALSTLNGNFFLYDSPLFISGQCRSFGGGERLIATNKLKRIYEVQFLPINITDTWSKYIPTYWCADTIWPQSAIEALSAMDVKCNIKYDKILARFIFNHPSYLQECLPLINIKWQFIMYIVIYAFRKANIFFYHRLTWFTSKKTRLKKYHIVRDIFSINEAVKYLENVK